MCLSNYLFSQQMWIILSDTQIHTCPLTCLLMVQLTRKHCNKHLKCLAPNKSSIKEDVQGEIATDQFSTNPSHLSAVCCSVTGHLLCVSSKVELFSAFLISYSQSLFAAPESSDFHTKWVLKCFS